MTRPRGTARLEEDTMNPETSRPVDGEPSQQPIAVVGLAGLYPGARDLHQFWRNVVEGVDCITDVPDTHWRVEDYYDPDPTVADKTYCRKGGFVPPVDFDPVAFGIPPSILGVTDILQVLSLVVARDVLDDAGCPDAPWYAPERTGVVLGVTGANSLTQPLAARLQSPVLKEVVRSCGLSDADAEEIDTRFRAAFAPWEENSFPGMLGNVVSGRIANRFDFGGTNCTVDAACASSLAAVRMAVDELQTGRADLMITGGCDAENTILMYMCFSKTPAFSKAGRIRPFDADADGTLIGEGIGMIALKRLPDAVRDGDRVYAVIKGLGSGSDGRGASIYAPRAEGQVRTLRRAYDSAGCSPATIGLVDAHGTGTPVGDATELTALQSVYGPASDDRQYAAIGSVKSQIGHTKGAAGAASLIKVAMALHEKVLPPTINVDRPFETLDPSTSAFYVNTVARPWIRDPFHPRRAALSAFGFGGTNFHAVLEEAATDRDGEAVRYPAARGHLWHAADPRTLADLVEAGGPTHDGPVPAGHARVGFACADVELDALRALCVAELRRRPDAETWSHPRGIHYRRRELPGGHRTAALFAGQGSQHVDMGRTAALALPPVRAAFDAANAGFVGDTPLSRVVFPPPAFDAQTRTAQEAALRRTAYAQPAIGALSRGQLDYLRLLGFRPDTVGGHSFGELTALWAAGCLSADELNLLARARGSAMAPPEDTDFDPGAMVAVTAPEADVRARLDADLDICNYNAPDQFVVGGGTEAVERFTARCEADGVKAQRLPVAAAFHTRHVGHAVEAFRAAVDTVDVVAPAVPVYCNTRGATYGADVRHNRSVLVDQLSNPVDFVGMVRAMYADGVRVFVEIGPKAVLTSLVGRILPDADVVVIPTDGARDGDLALKQAAVRLAVLGLPVAGINRFTAEPPPARPAKPGAIALTGVNHVPAQRSHAYREALARPYTPSVAPVAAEPPVRSDAHPTSIVVVAQEDIMAHAPEAPSTPDPAGPARRGSVEVAAAERLPAVAGLAHDHLALHRSYLDQQLNVAQRLVGLLQSSDGIDEPLVAGVTAVKDHALSIGQVHTMAGETLRDLVALGVGIHPEQTPGRITIAADVSTPTPIAAAPSTAAYENVRPVADHVSP
ncbi:MAG TPA: beta-ketoacyl synthase N-terminal-like domain-containing protein, partial [Actinoplanes sp.]